MMYTGDALFKTLLKYDFNLMRGNESISTYLEKHFQNYMCDVVQAMQQENPLLGTGFITMLSDKMDLLRNACDKIIRVFILYLDGRIKPAYEEAYELFHIKENRRSIIGAYRYSVPGFPCLYLAGGLELAWFESGMPRQFSYCKMNIAVDGKDALRLIDFSNRPMDLLANIYIEIKNAEDDVIRQTEILNYLQNYILTYPLAAACSVIVQDRNTKFVEEYILPQMLMQWIRESDKYDGVRYKSSLNSTLVQGLGAVNAALPIREFREDGLCEHLTSKIEVSDIEFFDVNEDFKKYKEGLVEIEKFKRSLQLRVVQSGRYLHYAGRLIEFCDTLKKIYEQLMSGSDADMELLMYSVSSLSDYKSLIVKAKPILLSDDEEHAKTQNAEFDSAAAEADIREFNTLVSKILKKHAEFHFGTTNVGNFEKI